MKVLFICTGNAARSQMAEAIYNTLTNSTDARSAGTETIVGKPMPDDVLEVMGEIGIDVSVAIRKMISENMVQNADRVVLMTDKSLPEYLSKSNKVEVWGVKDPRGLGVDAHRMARDIIKSRIRGLLK